MIEQKLSAIKSADSNLYQHLVKVLKGMLLNNDRQSFRMFEYYSQKVKEGEQATSEFRQEEYEHLGKYCEKMKEILDKPNAGTEEEPAEAGPTGYVPNLIEEAEWFEKCGLGFGEELTYIIFKSLQKFSIVKQIKQLKFWGKIIGTSADYYIAESPAEAGEEELPPGVEPKGTGINKWAYWVTTDLNGQWKELPVISPTQLVTSRNIKYFFTGNLDRLIWTNPHFDGQQAHLLKCQIVRMTYSCSLVPRKMYSVNPDDNKQIDPPSEEWKLPDFDYLSLLENWVHLPQNILRNGRMAVIVPQAPEGVEVDEQKLKKELEDKDPLEDRLKPISTDQFKDGRRAWAVNTYGDCTEYRAMSKNKEKINYGFICLRSLIWKGWHTLYHNKQWISMYAGYGLKSTDDWYFPKCPETVLSEGRDYHEQAEPNFPPEPEKKEDDEKKPEEAAEDDG